MSAPLHGRMPRGGPARSRGPAVVSLLVHIVVVFAIGRMISVPVLDFLRRSSSRPVVETVTFVEPPVVPPARSAAGRAPRVDGPTVAAQRDERQPIPQVTVVPAGIDTASGGRPPAGPPAGANDGRMAFGTGVSGLSTGRVDPRLVAPPPIPDAVVRATPRAPDTYVDEWISAFWDSVATARRAQGRRPGDWTFGSGDSKYGMDEKFIYFGKFKLPTVLLAMLPINAQANPSMVDRNRALQSMLYEIDFHARRAGNEADFRKAVDELRARRERERQAAKEPPPSRPPRGGTISPELP